MTAVRHNIVIEQGSKFETTIRAKNSDGTAMNLTGYSGQMQIRSKASSSTVLLEASTANGRIAIDGPTGTIVVTIGADVTVIQTWRTAVYDLEVSNSSSNVIRIAEGFAYMNPEVTR